MAITTAKAETLEWLAWFVAQPQAYCRLCNVMNELNPPPWWRANCRHFPVRTAR